MVRGIVSAACAAALIVPYAAADGLYMKGSPVLQLDGKSYHAQIAQSNHTSIVEFYAPWCGHCKNLKPAYEKAAKALAGLAKVAAVNCDEETNKPFCGSMGVQGFPTLKIVRPGKKPGRPNVEDYQGQRSAKAIVDAVKDKIANHVKRLSDKTFDEWLETDKHKPKAVLFTDKGTTSALLKALAIDYLGSIAIGQIRDKEKATSEKYGVTSYPTFILLPGGDERPLTYSGELQKASMSNFLSQVATPNPDPAPKKAKAKSTPASKAAKDSSKLSAASKSHRSADSASSRATQTTETLEKDGSESPGPIVDADGQKPIQLTPDAPASLPILMTDSDVKSACLTPKSGTCVLVLAADAEAGTADAAGSSVTSSLVDIHHKLSQRGKIFPFYVSMASSDLRSKLGVESTGLAVVAVNGKKGWIKKYGGAVEAARDDVETWIDALRMGEGKKERLAEGLVEEAEKIDAQRRAQEGEAKVKVDEVKAEHDEL